MASSVRRGGCISCLVARLSFSMNCKSFDEQSHAYGVIPAKHISTSTGKPLTFRIKACGRSLHATDKRDKLKCTHLACVFLKGRGQLFIVVTFLLKFKSTSVFQSRPFLFLSDPYKSYSISTNAAQ